MVVRGRGTRDRNKGQGQGTSPTTTPAAFIPPRARSYTLTLVRPPRIHSYHPWCSFVHCCGYRYLRYYTVIICFITYNCPVFTSPISFVLSLVLHLSKSDLSIFLFYLLNRHFGVLCLNSYNKSVAIL